MSIINPPLPGTTREPLYPDSDGELMAETGFHAAAMAELFQSLYTRYASRTDAYIAMNMFLYYEQGNPRACRAPDVMACIGVAGNHLRRSFRIWEERAPPTVVFEVTSSKTRREDEVEKPAIYARIGVAEYYLFDPEGEYLHPRLQGYRLRGDRYETMATEPGEELRFLSRELGLIIEPEGVLLRLTDARSGQQLPWMTEWPARATEAEATAAQAQKHAHRAEQQAKRVERRLEQAERRAEAERRRAEALEEEIRRLRGEP